MKKQARAELREELQAAKLGDARRSQRLGAVVERAAARPNASFPRMARNESELEGIYRFLSNEHVKPEAILEPHIAATVERASRETGDVLVVHDTTYAEFEGEREGMGRIHVNDRGLWAHVALGLGADRMVLGVVGMRHGTRHGPSKWKGSRRLKGVAEEEPAESQRWPDLVTETGKRLAPCRPIHVMDREADWWELYEQLVAQDQRFVIRLAHDRGLEGGGRVSEQWPGASTVAVREVQLSARADGHSARARKRHPHRKARKAKLEVRGLSMALRSRKRTLMLNVVKVIEVDAPDGCTPVEWNLITTESIASEADLLRIVDTYRARWVVEELFKALKTGCAFEKRQLGSYAALVNALAVFLPIASMIVRLRDIARRSPDGPASLVIDAKLLDVLRRIARRPLPAKPTAKHVTYAIAALGGHLPRNGDPGWLTLARGFEDLLNAVRIAALLEM